VAGRQMNVNLQVAGRAMEMVKPFRLPLAALTGENLRSFVDAEKALIDNMMKRNPAPRAKVGHKPARRARKPVAQAAHAGA